MRSFFDDYPRFFETSDVGAWPIRLALRHHAVIETNRHLLEGARVLDLASHDGRWSLAALKAGAAHVTGIEARERLVSASRENMIAYGMHASSYTFLIGDLNHATQAPVNCDVALCLGYFYHTLNHLALMQYLASTKAQHLVLDGMVEPSEGDIIRVYAEETDSEANGITNSGIFDGKILVGHPTVSVLVKMLDHYGYDSAVFDWSQLLTERGIIADKTKSHGQDNPVGDYARGARATIRASRRA